MDKDALVKQLMATYVEELDDQVRALNRDLLELEKAPPGGPPAELLKTLFRTAHSLKGASRSVKVGLVEAACHLLEDILTALQRGEAALDAELFAALFAAADAIEDAGRRLRREEDVADGALASMIPRLESLAARPMPPGGQVAGASLGAPSAPAGAAAPSVPVPAHETGSQPPPTPPTPTPPAAAGEGQIPVALQKAPPPPTPLSAREIAPREVAPREPEQVATTFRVAAEKLDSLLVQSGELLAARLRIRLRVEDLQTLSGFVARWQAEWSTTARRLRSVVQHMGALPKGEAPVSAKPLTQLLPALIDKTTDNVSRLQSEASRLLSGLVADARHLDLAAGAVGEEVRRVRMLPFSEACLGLDRLVRDLSKEAGKQVDLVVDAGDVELDRPLLEGMKDSLRHLVRNAIDHGIETPQERRAAGKPPRARITITAALRGAQVEVAVADDGRGLELAALRDALRKAGRAEPAGEPELAQAIFSPGVSTARLVSGLSGRGMGLDIVRSRAEAAHGAIDVSFDAGRGTRFTVTVPLTLTSFRALLVAVGSQTFGFVSTNVQKVGRLEMGELQRVEGREMLMVEGRWIPIAALEAVLGLPRRAAANNGNRWLPFVVVAAGERRVAFLVAEHLAEQEVMIKSLGARLQGVPYIAGATILPTGRIALILNAANLTRAAIERTPDPLSQPAVAAPKKRVLLAEDSVTTRTLIASILEDAGYEVVGVPDGAAAWEFLQEQSADVVVSDIAMPRMDGFALTAAVRKTSRISELPVVLVTSRETKEDKARGAAAGADAYLVKSAFDQRTLLETIAQLL